MLHRFRSTMKKNLVTSFIDGINDTVTGERYRTILNYFYPELITSFLLFLPIWLDAYFIGYLHSTTAYATVCVTNTFLHWIIKAAEAFAVGTMILSGQLNGSGDKHGAGRTLASAFWVSCTVGMMLGVSLYFGAPFIYALYGVPKEMAVMGTGYLKLRAISIFLMFMYQACAGFLRGIKNTRIPMLTFACGMIAFVIFDYLFIFGSAGFPAMGIEGSALASVIQYAACTAAVLIYLLVGPYTRPYAINLLVRLRDISFIKEIIILSWPVMIDKSILPIAYIWLARMINPMGTNAIASFGIIREMERFAFLPAIAFAQVVTFLVSNDIGAHRWAGVKSNIKKVLFASICMVFTVLVFFSLFPGTIVRLFDQRGDFTIFSAHVFPVVSIFLICDIFQVVLAGALRGAANVKYVMMTRLIVFSLFFAPISYGIAQLPLRHDIKFILLYCSFYLTNAVASATYLYQFRTDKWKKKAGVIDD